MNSDLREERIRKARAILNHSQYQSLSRREQKKVERSLMNRGLSRRDLNSLRNEISRRNIIDKIDIRALPRDVFRHLIISGQLHGSDLIALCGIDSITSEKCNHDNYWIFRQLLLREFNLKSYRHNPRELYITLHKIAFGLKTLLAKIGEIRTIVSEDQDGESEPLNPFSEFAFEVEPIILWELLYQGLVAEFNSFYTIPDEILYRIFGFLYNEYWHYVNTHPSESHRDIEDIWYEDIRPILERGEMYKNKRVLEDGSIGGLIYREESMVSYGFNIEDVDNFWDNAREAVSELPEPDKKTINRNYRGILGGMFREMNHSPDIEEVIDMLKTRYEVFYSPGSGNNPEILARMKEDNLRRVEATRRYLENLDLDLFKLDAEEIYSLIMLHRLIADGTLSPTMPVALFEV